MSNGVRGFVVSTNPLKVELENGKIMQPDGYKGPTRLKHGWHGTLFDGIWYPDE